MSEIKKGDRVFIMKNTPKDYRTLRQYCFTIAYIRKGLQKGFEELQIGTRKDIYTLSIPIRYLRKIGVGKKWE